MAISIFSSDFILIKIYSRDVFVNVYILVVKMMNDAHDPEQIWQLPEVQQALTTPEQHHLFVVLGTSVLEVGRDFDADWGIIEPSSMRSLIQFAGRIQRHRQQVPECENLVILERNVRALRGETVAYCRPGFETERHLLPHHVVKAV